MTGKNETRVLLLSLLMTVGMVGLGTWFLREKLALGPKLNPTQESVTSRKPLPQYDRFLDVENVPEGMFTYGGSTTWATIRGTLDLDIQKARPEFRLSYVQQPGVAPSTQSGIELLSQGKVMFSLASRLPTTEMLQTLEAQGIELRLVHVADSFDVVAVNPSLSVSKLSVDQINAIRSGKVTNWNELGGADLPIQEFTRDVNADMLDSKFEARSNLKTSTTPLESIRGVATTPGGLSVLAASLAVPQCSVKVLDIVTAAGETVSPYKKPPQKPLSAPDQCLTQKPQIDLATFKGGDYPSELRNTLYVVIKQNGKLEQQAGEAYATFLLSDEGKKLLEKAGYVAVQ
jgi:phosphate transport system substrate-binding protein